MVVWQTLVPLAVVAQDVLDEAWHGCLCAVLLMAGLMWLRWNCSMPARPEICQDKHPAISIPDDLAHIAAIDRNILFKCPTLDRSRLDGSAKFCSSYRNSARSGSHLPTPSGRRKLSELRQLYRDFNNIGVRGFVLNGAPVIQKSLEDQLEAQIQRVSCCVVVTNGSHNAHSHGRH